MLEERREKKKQGLDGAFLLRRRRLVCVVMKLHSFTINPICAVEVKAKVKFN
jgi:hypothetical protein